MGSIMGMESTMGVRVGEARAEAEACEEEKLGGAGKEPSPSWASEVVVVVVVVSS